MLLKWHYTVLITGTDTVSAAGTPALLLQCVSDDETGADVFTGKCPPLLCSPYPQHRKQQ